MTAVNPYLQWETTTTWDIGLDVTFLNRINLTFDYYDKKTSDILMRVATPEGYQQIIDGERIKRKGYAINSYFGYKTAGLYQSQASKFSRAT